MNRGRKRCHSKGGKERVRAKRSSKVDWISKFPDCLLSLILLKLPTKEVVKTSVLSSRWRNLWKYIPGLDLDYEDFSDHYTFVSFIDTFLGFHSKSCLQSFKLMCGLDGLEWPENSLTRRWINTVIDRKVKHIDVFDNSSPGEVEMPPTLYTCESLESLKLDGCGIKVADLKFVSLPSLKALDLIDVYYDDDTSLETLISGCPVLESLFIGRTYDDDIEILRVCSQSLLSFTYVSYRRETMVKDLVVEINAPKLKYLELSDFLAYFVLNDVSSLEEAYIDTKFEFDDLKFDPNNLPKKNMIRNFLRGISCVKDMTITARTLQVIYNYSKCEQLPLFRKLSFLRVEFENYRLEMLLLFLENCPNLKSLVLGTTSYPEEEEKEGKEGMSIIFGPRSLLSSLEYVEIERPLKGNAMEMYLVRYLLENSPILKKLTLCLDKSRKKKESVFKELLTMRRLSTASQVIVC